MIGLLLLLGQTPAPAFQVERGKAVFSSAQGELSYYDRVLQKVCRGETVRVSVGKKAKDTILLEAFNGEPAGVYICWLENGEPVYKAEAAKSSRPFSGQGTLGATRSQGSPAMTAPSAASQQSGSRGRSPSSASTGTEWIIVTPTGSIGGGMGRRGVRHC